MNDTKDAPKKEEAKAEAPAAKKEEAKAEAPPVKKEDAVMVESDKPGRNPMRTESAPSFDEIKAWIKDWVREELHLMQVGVDREGRKERNP